MGVSRNGLTISTLCTPNVSVSKLKWEEIKDLAYSRKTFTIQLLKKAKSILFLFEDTQEARYLWNFCIQMHNSYIHYWSHSWLFAANCSRFRTPYAEGATLETRETCHGRTAAIGRGATIARVHQPQHTPTNNTADFNGGHPIGDLKIYQTNISTTGKLSLFLYSRV
ncbi:unnamed protein product [Dibothriocephalus latus]|uniref:FERM domain-containing protein n=1 Tax=Dibothriocephalus latus TaxID=60516 RepID=A0A3P7LUY2_DIBLA|nr:unnamed protein product [Dibothriocephalus latus]